MQNELDKARTEKNYFAPTQNLKKRHAKEIRKLEEKHRDEIEFWEGKIQKILVKNKECLSNKQELIDKIEE